MGIDDWLMSAGPFGLTWAVFLAYCFIFVLVGAVAVFLSRMTKAKVVYTIILLVGLILFIKAVFHYDITGILWDAWQTVKSRIAGVIWWG